MLSLKIAVTGAKGIGKSTTIRRILEFIPQKPFGFITRPVEEGENISGFEIVDLLMAHLTQLHILTRKFYSSYFGGL